MGEQAHGLLKGLVPRTLGRVLRCQLSPNSGVSVTCVFFFALTLRLPVCRRECEVRVLCARTARHNVEPGTCVGDGTVRVLCARTTWPRARLSAITYQRGIRNHGFLHGSCACVSAKSEFCVQGREGTTHRCAVGSISACPIAPSSHCRPSSREQDIAAAAACVACWWWHSADSLLGFACSPAAAWAAAVAAAAAAQPVSPSPRAEHSSSSRDSRAMPATDASAPPPPPPCAACNWWAPPVVRHGGHRYSTWWRGRWLCSVHCADTRSHALGPKRHEVT